MKKIIVVSTLVLLIVGCADKNQDRKDAFLNAAQSYYQHYALEYQVDTYEVSLKNLRKAKEELKEKYDLDLLSSCKEESKVTFQIENKKIVKTSIQLNCP